MKKIVHICIINANQTRALEEHTPLPPPLPTFNIVYECNDNVFYVNFLDLNGTLDHHQNEIICLFGNSEHFLKTSSMVIYKFLRYFANEQEKRRTNE